jgi:hypothetical protein
MNENKLMQQINAIFSIFMVLFYLGAGIFLMFYFKNTLVDRAVLIISGSVFIFYGLYRAYSTYIKIIKAFFKHNDDDL